MFQNRIREKKDELIAGILGCVRINSVETKAKEGMPFGEGPAEALSYALELADKMGFVTKNIDNMAGYAEYGQGEEMVAVLGHLDIVPAGEGWEYNPFGELCQDRIYGRGTLDNKGPILAALYALDAVRASGAPLKRRIRIIFGTNEETGCLDMVRYNKTEETPVMGFTPDADYPVIFSEKGMAEFSFAKKLGEKAGLLCAKAGTAVNLVPDRAMAELSRKDASTYKVQAKGAAAHASTPKQGENAISKLMEQLEQESLTEELKDFVRFYNTFVGKETDGTSLGIACRVEKFGEVTVNAGLLEGDAEQIKVTFDCRYPWGEDFEKAAEHLKQLAEEQGLEFELSRNTHPLYIPEDSTLVTTLQQVYEEHTGRKEPPIVIGGGTYAKSVENIVAFGPVFPEQENVIHQKNEYISIDHLLKNTEIMADAMYRLAK